MNQKENIKRYLEEEIKVLKAINVDDLNSLMDEINKAREKVRQSLSVGMVEALLLRRIIAVTSIKAYQAVRTRTLTLFA